MEQLEAAKVDWYKNASRKEQALARKAEIEASEAEAGRDHWEAESYQNREATYFGAIGPEGAQSVLVQLDHWARLDQGAVNGEPYLLRLCSPGGSVIDGLAIIDTVHRVREAGAVINTEVVGFGASMAAVVLQAGAERRMSRNSFLMLHEVSSSASGSLSRLEDNMDFTKRLNERIIDILLERATIDREAFLEKWNRRDWWLSATEAVELGFADRIV